MVVPSTPSAPPPRHGMARRGGRVLHNHWRLRLLQDARPPLRRRSLQSPWRIVLLVDLLLSRPSHHRPRGLCTLVEGRRQLHPHREQLMGAESVELTVPAPLRSANALCGASSESGHRHDDCTAGPTPRRWCKATARSAATVIRSCRHHERSRRCLLAHGNRLSFTEQVTRKTATLE